MNKIVEKSEDILDYERIRVIGPPGTGKTTYLMKVIGQLIDKQLLPVVFCSFTNAAVNEAKDRISSQFGYSKNNLRWVTTIHSRSKRLNKYKPHILIVESKDRNEFISDHLGGSYQIASEKQFDLNDQDASDFTFENESVAKFAFQLYNYIQSNYPENWHNLGELTDVVTKELYKLNPPDDPGLHTASQFIDFFHAWESHKRANGKIDFIDILMDQWKSKKRPLPLNYLIVDEFQDLTKLQYLIFEKWASRCAHKIIAGDPNQSIYGFAGGSPDYLEEYENDKTIFLDQSYRLPANVLSYVQQILPDSPWLANLKSREGNGRLERIDRINFETEIAKMGIYMSTNGFMTAIEKGQDHMFLARTNRWVDVIARSLLDVGLVYRRLKVSSEYSEKFLGIYNACFLYFLKQPIKQEELRDFMEAVKFSDYRRIAEEQNIPSSRRNQNAKSIRILGGKKVLDDWCTGKAITNLEFKWLKNKRELTYPEYIQFFVYVPSDDPDSTDSVVKRIIYGMKNTLLQVYLFRNLFVHGIIPSQISELPIILGTIHQSKGKEADSVYLDAQATYYELEDKLLDIGEERRVWYVGTSRTKTNLFIIGAEYESRFIPNQEIKTCESVFDVSEQLKKGKMEFDALHLIYHDNWKKMRKDNGSDDVSSIRKLPEGNPRYETLEDFF